MNDEFVISKEMQYEIEDSIHAHLENELYPKLIVYFIRQKYSINDELSLNRQRDKKLVEYEEYNNYCESAKTYAKELLRIEDVNNMSTDI